MVYKAINWNFEKQIIKQSVLCLFLLLTASSLMFSQIIDNRSGNAFKDDMFFSQQFLWLNKIKSVTGIKSIKRPNRPIEQRPDIVIYKFNEVGLLNEIDQVTSVLHLVDSLTIQYKRNDLGEVELKRENGSRGYYTTQYNYDERGRLMRLDYGKAENIAQEKGKLIPGQVTNINSESFVWTDNQNGIIRKSNFNNYGLHYSDWVITRNAEGYIQSEVEELKMSGRSVSRLYTYNDKGWIDQIETKDNQSTTVKREVFRYDKLGNLLKLEFFEGSEMVREVEVLYTSTMLIEAFLDHYLRSHDIEITKFTYEYFK